MRHSLSFTTLSTAIIAGALSTLSLCGAFAASAAPVSAGLIHASGHLNVRNATEESTNWAGYADQTTSGRKFTYVGGSWVEPKASCSATASNPDSSFWVGIDGYSSGTVEQLGTDSDCLGKTPAYYAWWEMYPEGSIGLAPTQYPVKPGDRLTASVSVSHGRFTLTLTSSEGWRFETMRIGASGLRQSSAEWIAEAPQVGNSISPLARFSSFGFYNCRAATNNGLATPISSSHRTVYRLNMVSNGGRTKATASSLSQRANAFGVVWDHA